MEPALGHVAGIPLEEILLGIAPVAGVLFALLVGQLKPTSWSIRR